MRQSALFTKTRKEAPKDEVSRNAQLLIRAGYVHKEMAGVYALLPLGLRVVKNIESIIRQEINAIGGQEIEMTTLQLPELWKKSNRWSDEVVDMWFKTTLSNGSELGIGNTHEEPISNMLLDHVSSHRDLPLYVYQFQTKFRNELRAKSGLMRGREFLMKDLYSFSKTEKSFRDFYETCAMAYQRIFERAGIGNNTFRTLAGGGSFTEGFTDEFQTLSDAGEDTIFLHRKSGTAFNQEIFSEDLLQERGLKIDDVEEVKSIEVGNIFPLGTKFAKAIGLQYKDDLGQLQYPIMGSYGIGLGRLMGTVVETLSDDKGIIWPESIAPFKVHIVQLGDSEEVVKAADDLYQNLIQKNCEVLLDDRKTSAGAKLADMDLLGVPHRVIVSDRSLQSGGFEYSVRKSAADPKIITESEMYNLLCLGE